MGKQIAVMALAAALVVSPTLAQGIVDDSFVLMEPGLSVSVFLEATPSRCEIVGGVAQPGWSSFVCEGDDDNNNVQLPIGGGSGSGVDAVGNFYQIRLRNWTAEDDPLPSSFGNQYVYVVERHTGGQVQVVAEVPHWKQVCKYSGTVCSPCLNAEGLFRQTWLYNLRSDSINGHLYFAVRSRFKCENTPIDDVDGDGYGIVRLTGLPTFFDILNSYEPPNALAFRVPPRPEGLPSGDRFDVYVGDVSTLPDFSQAEPLACDMGADSVPGDRVTVADALPSPDSGEARYYLTAVTSGVQRRAGRQAAAGTLSGRDASGLPACVMP